MTLNFIVKHNFASMMVKISLSTSLLGKSHVISKLMNFQIEFSGPFCRLKCRKPSSIASFRTVVKDVLYSM